MQVPDVCHMMVVMAMPIAIHFSCSCCDLQVVPGVPYFASKVLLGPQVRPVSIVMSSISCKRTFEPVYLSSCMLIDCA
jgi:predicted metal-binding protein